MHRYKLYVIPTTMGNLHCQMRIPNDNLQQLLEGYEQERIELDVKFLNQALVAATLNNNHKCIGKLIKMGARNIDDCIQLAKEEEVHYPIIMLLLMKAALTGDESFLKLLINPHADILHELPAHSDSLEHSLLRELTDIWTFEKCYRILSMTDALEVAQQCGQYSVHRKLMILIHPGWSNLNLTYIDARVLEMCNWLTNLDLSANKLSSLPSNVGILYMVSLLSLLIFNCCRAGKRWGWGEGGDDLNSSKLTIYM